MTNADNEFHASVNACLRALANDMTLDLSIGDSVDADTTVLSYTPIADIENQYQVSLIRGLSDSFAMMHLFHDSSVHQSLAPKDPVADRLYTLLERERFEAVGCRQYAGVARNLERAWVLGHSENALSRFGGAEQLEFVLSCLARELLITQTLPPLICKYLDVIRGPVEDLVGDLLNELPLYLNQQSEYGLCVLKVIERLGFDVAPHTSGTTNSPANQDSEGVQSEDEVEQDEFDEESVLELRQHEKGEDKTVNEDAEREQASAIVRNVEHERATEADDPQINDIVDNPDAGNDGQINSSNDTYRVYVNSQDEECIAAHLISTPDLKQFREMLDQHIREFEPLILPLANRLQRVLLSRQKSEWIHDMDEGELDPKRLSRIITVPLSPLSFREKADEFIRDTTVTLLIDNSRSMSGTPILTAAASADLITRVLERCGVSAEVLGFTTVTMYGGQIADQWRAAGCPQNVGRINALRHIVYKAADQSWRRSRMNFGLMLNPDILNQNIDGEALLWATSRMHRRPESRQILIVLTDGRPSDSSTLKANSPDLLANHLKQVIERIEKRRTREVIGIGIGHDVSEYYAQSIRVDEIDQLGSVMLSELTRLLKQ